MATRQPWRSTDPLARHNALLADYTNKTMHDVTAYLATLK